MEIRGQPAEALRVYEMLLAQRLPHVRRGGLLGLVRLGGPDAVPTILTAISDYNRVLTPAAIACIPALRGSGVTARFAAQLPKLPAAPQARLIEALADRGDPAAIGAIARAIAEPDQRVRLAVLRALGILGDASSVATLVTACGSDKVEAKTAATSLRTLKGKGVNEEIIRRLRQAQTPTRIELIGVLGDRRAAEAVAALLDEAKGADEQIANAALRAVGRVGSERDLPAALAWLTALQGEGRRAEAERAVSRLAQQLPAARRAEPVLAALAAAHDPPAQASLLAVLGTIADEKSYRAVAAAAGSPDPRVTDAAVHALAQWPNGRAEPALLQLLKTSPNETHRILALRGYVRLVDAATDRPQPEKARLLVELLTSSRQPAARKLVLSGLSRLAEPAALDAAAGCCADPAVGTEAATAAIAVAGRLSLSRAQEISAAVRKVAAVVPDETLRGQARSLIVPPLPDVFLDALTPVKMKSGNSGGRPMANRNCTGGPLRLKGQTFTRGVGEHAVADLTYPLQPGYKRFVALVGLDNQVGRFGDVHGSSLVRLYADGKLMAETRVLRGAGDWCGLDIRHSAGRRRPAAGDRRRRQGHRLRRRGPGQRRVREVRGSECGACP